MSDRRIPKVKNKNPAARQITAEQILREATERQERSKPIPQQHIADQEELNDYRLKKRKGFEDYIRANRTHISSWLKYAAWEELQGQFERSRSVFERALQVEPRNQTLWLKYAEMEMKNKNVNHARNVFDRAVSVLPRIDMFWYKYTYMEEMLDNIQGCRLVFERWMKWEPNDDAWMAYVKFEQRYKEKENARNVFQRFVNTHPLPKNWIKWSKFEENLGEIDKARLIYEQCGETLGEEHLDQNLYVSFAKFEIRQKEFERARMIYKFALEKLPKEKQENLNNSYTQFEKQYGGKEGIEDVVTNKRRVKYENDIQNNPNNYDVWFDYARLEESVGDEVRIRDIYERALAQIPLIKEKRYWRRYVYIWLFYACWEESIAKNVERAGEIYSKLIDLIPHKTFTFAKVWLLQAKYFIRLKELTKARKVLGRAIGMCPKDKLFKGYIELEVELREFDRARMIYQKFLEYKPNNCYAWVKYCDLEKTLGDYPRTRGIFEIAIGQNDLDMPEVLWKSYIDFEVEEKEYDNVRKLYERLLEKTPHVKVWISYAKFELLTKEENEENTENEDNSQGILRSREIFQKAYNYLKQNGLESSKEDRQILLENWKQVEIENNSSKEFVDKVASMFPKIVKKRKKLEDGTGWEEYFDYIFPDDEVDKTNFKLLEMAQKWKMGEMKIEKKTDEDEEESDNEESDEEENEEGEESGDEDSS
ncbi:Crooked neck-like protein 1 [Clydaea vesicula]|uniref:Crooked neck-like protein 1 n=1 Tax=Clydaea vesicula TaxID=447962 RepID=A0AAD5U269_9FUNG|nr:Crooked neck-like protein 1 [Clydaea vesicula]